MVSENVEGTSGSHSAGDRISEEIGTGIHKKAINPINNRNNINKEEKIVERKGIIKKEGGEHEAGNLTHCISLM